jgi:hypothetical protein
MNVELNTELENESYKVQIKELELDGRYLYIRGIVLDVDQKEAFEFEDSIELSDFCWDERESDNDDDLNDNDEQIKET